MKAGDVNPTTNIVRPGITIKIQNLSKRFNHEWIFRGLTSSFHPGNIYAITGPNGSGKSTLLQILWGQVPPSSGDIQYVRNGTNIPIEEVYKDISIATRLHFFCELLVPHSNFIRHIKLAFTGTGFLFFAIS